MIRLVDRRRLALVTLVGIAAVASIGVAAELTGDGGSTVAGRPSGGAGVPAPDPLRWNRVQWRQVAVSLPQVGEPALNRIDGLTTAGPGIVGWGRVAQPRRNQFNDMGALYVSATGDDWTVVPLADGVGPLDTSEPAHVADGPAGVLVMGGVCCAEERMALWLSHEGGPWQRLPSPEMLAGAFIVSLVDGGDRYIAAGTVNDVPTIWTSVDAIAWNEVDGAAAGFAVGGLGSVRAVPGGFVAAGWLDVGDTYDGALWTSSDGLEWKKSDIGPLFEGDLDTALYRVVPYAGGWWMTGNEGPHAERVECERLLGQGAAVGWKPQPPPVASLDCGWGVETHWVSTDGRTWERVRLPWAVRGVEPAPGSLVEFRHVQAGGPGLVVLGEGSGEGRPSLFVSRDGRSWTGVGADNQFPANFAIQGMVVDGRRIIATGDGPTIWIGDVR